MRRRKSILDDEQDTVITGEFSVAELFGEDLTYKNGKTRLKVRLKLFWYGLLDKRDEHRYRRQRAKRGYSDYDVLDIQMWLVRTLRPMIEDILSKLHTHPDTLTFEEWKAILEEMITSLKIMDWDDEIFVREHFGINTDDFGVDTCNLIESKRQMARISFSALFAKWFWDLTY